MINIIVQDYPDFYQFANHITEIVKQNGNRIKANFYYKDREPDKNKRIANL